MSTTRFFGILAGMIIGAILGFFLYLPPAWFLISGNVPGLLPPPDMIVHIFRDSLVFGAASGAAVGLLSGAVLQAASPRGKLTWRIVGWLFVSTAICVGITQWNCLQTVPWNRFWVAVLAGLIAYLFAALASDTVSQIERIREIKELETK